jgi:hypothetical protein
MHILGIPKVWGFFATFCGLVLNLAFHDEQFAFSKIKPPYCLSMIAT